MQQSPDFQFLFSAYYFIKHCIEHVQYISYVKIWHFLIFYCISMIKLPQILSSMLYVMESTIYCLYCWLWPHSVSVDLLSRFLHSNMLNVMDFFSQNPVMKKNKLPFLFATIITVIFRLFSFLEISQLFKWSYFVRYVVSFTFFHIVCWFNITNYNPFRRWVIFCTQIREKYDLISTNNMPLIEGFLVFF